MHVGDLIRLKQLFIPTTKAIRGYRYAVVHSIIRLDEADSASEVIELLVKLCEGDRTLPYTDEWGTQPIYSFYLNEVERADDTCPQAIQPSRR
jgi:hypothetical protein